jgi:hypothetical protein
MANNTMRPPADKAWGPKHIAHYLDVSERHVRDIRRQDDTFPAPRMVGSKPRWCPNVVQRWVADGGSPVLPVTPQKMRKGAGRVH